MTKINRALSRHLGRYDRAMLLRSPIAWVLQIHHIVPAVLLFHLAMSPLVYHYTGKSDWILPMEQVFYVLSAGATVVLVLWARAAVRRSVHASKSRSEGLQLLLGALLCSAALGTVPGLTVLRLEAQIEAVLTVDGLCREVAAIQGICERCKVCHIGAWGDETCSFAGHGCIRVHREMAKSHYSCPATRDARDSAFAQAQLAIASWSQDSTAEVALGSCHELSFGEADGSLYSVATPVGQAVRAVFWREGHPGERLAALLVIMVLAGFVALARVVERQTLLSLLAALCGAWSVVAFIDLVFLNIHQHVTVTLFLGVHVLALLLLVCGRLHRALWVPGVHGGLVALFMAPFAPFLWVWRLSLADKPQLIDFAVPRGLLAAFAELVARADAYPHGEVAAWGMSAGLTLITMALFAPLAWRTSARPVRRD